MLESIDNSTEIQEAVVLAESQMALSCLWHFWGGRREQ